MATASGITRARFGSRALGLRAQRGGRQKRREVIPPISRFAVPQVGHPECSHRCWIAEIPAAEIDRATIQDFCHRRVGLVDDSDVGVGDHCGCRLQAPASESQANDSCYRKSASNCLVRETRPQAAVSQRGRAAVASGWKSTPEVFATSPPMKRAAAGAGERRS